MNINDLCDDIILFIFSNFDLRTRRSAGDTCRRWNRLAKRSWRNVHSITLYTLYERPRIPKGKYLNRSLHWVLKRCGKYLKILDLSDPDPDIRFVKANERTFSIIGRYCPSLEEINFTCMLLLNGLLHEMSSKLNCETLKRINMNCSFNHYCAIHDGLSVLYKSCPRIEYLNISRSLNARVQDCAELWPITLQEVHINHAWALTSYSLWSLVKCCPNLRLFSMCGNQCGMDGGLKFVFSRLTNLSVLRLDEYPGDTDLGIRIGQLENLRELHLSGSSMVNDHVITAVSRGCKKLEMLDLGVPEGHKECTRNGVLTDDGLVAIAYHLKGLKHLNLQGREHITDYGVCFILRNVNIDHLALANSNFVTDITLQSLSTYCFKELRLSQMNNITSIGLIRLCQTWFENCSPESKYNLRIHLHQIFVDIHEFLTVFKTVTINSSHEFVMDADHTRPRRTVNLYCDLLLTLF